MHTELKECVFWFVKAVNGNSSEFDHTPEHVEDFVMLNRLDRFYSSWPHDPTIACNCEHHHYSRLSGLPSPIWS